MPLTEADVADGFWRHRPEDEFPPAAVERPEEYAGAERLNVACTQTELGASRQRSLVRAWCEFLPTLVDVRFLWISTRINQALFEAACLVPRLEGLYVKWGAIEDLSAIIRRPGIRYLHVGSCPRITSIECLSELRSLEVLSLENTHRISDLSVLRRLRGLQGLELYGSEKGWRIEGLGPLGRLEQLRYLFLWGLRPASATLRPLHGLPRLRRLRVDRHWPRDEVLDLQLRRPELRIS